MKKIFGFIILASILLSNCEWLEENTPEGLSENEIIEGLKTALEVGTDSATKNLHMPDGYFRDQAVKILLPPEAETITSNLSELASFIPGGETVIQNKLDDLLLSLNRAAEDAADEALPILKSAITVLSIEDGWDILNGIVPESTQAANNFDSLAATHFLEIQTKADLITAFSTPINISLDKPFIGNTSTNDIWSTITGYYNDAVDLYNLAGILTGNSLDKIDTNLSEYTTTKALDGLFIKVGDEEKKIRKNPYEYVVDILEKVFGSL